MWPYIAAMAAAGLLKNSEDKKAANKQRKIEATIARNSPWTDMQAQHGVADPSALAAMMSGAGQGAMMGTMMKAGGGADNPADAVAPGMGTTGVGAGGVPMAPGSPQHTPYGQPFPNYWAPYRQGG